jgi:alanyl-tRNA synthetase
VAAITGGGGGGRPEMAQGGGKDAAKLEKALAQVPALVKEMLSSGAARPKRQTKT